MIVEILVVAFIAVIFVLIGYFVGRTIAVYKVEKEWEKTKLPKILEERLKQSRAVIGGQFSEQIAPYLPDFPYKPTEVRFVGKPVDFIVFKGIDSKEPEEIIFVEVKSGKSALNPVEKRIKELVQDKKIGWFEYRVPEEITKWKI